MAARNRQTEIYINGLSGLKPVIPLSYPKLEEAARLVLSARAFHYIAGGAGRESTITNNRQAFEAYRILPHMLKGHAEVDTSVHLFGKHLQSPFFFSPLGVLELAHKEADTALARAAETLRIPVMFSNQASVPLEECARIMKHTPFFFQLYWSKSEDLVRSLVRRAERTGATGIVVTLDTTILGWRPRDLALGYLPFLEGKGIAQYTSDPVFTRLAESYIHRALPSGTQKPGIIALFNLFAQASRLPGSTFRNLLSRRSLGAVRCFIDLYSNPSLSWDHINRLRGWTKLPIILKGILHPEDAHLAVEAGVDGILVSNHGGRQVDGEIASLEALPYIVQVVEGKIPVLFDSGIRSGADAFKALALGASAVGVGRPFAMAMALRGAAGINELMQNYLAELELTMALSGCANLKDVNRSVLLNNRKD